MSKLADDDPTTINEAANGITAIVTAADPFLRTVAITTVADDDPAAATIKAADPYLHLTSTAKLADEDPDFVIDAGAELPLLTVLIATLADDDPIIVVTAGDGAFYAYAHQGESSNNSILMHDVVPTMLTKYVKKADEPT